MVSKGTDAKAKTNRKSNQGDSLSRSGGLGEFPSRRRNGLWAEQVGIDQKNCVGGYPHWQCPNCGHEDEIIGKILERLDALEAEHLEYVDAHQGRLRARLGESESKKDSFVKKSNQLRTEVYALITTSQYCDNCDDV